jgi:16S rRNA (cytosine967-C5)-methyltransferase
VSGQKPREIAAWILEQRENGAFVEELLERELARAHLSSVDRGLCQELIYGVVRWQETLDWLISRKVTQKPSKPALQNLLRLGLYQIFWLDRIPNHAAVHETVELAKARRLAPQAGFVNAVLRGYIREAAATKRLLEELKRSEPHIGYSHPDWLVARWRKRWSPEQTAELMDWNNHPPKTFARINTLKIDPGNLLTRWREEGVEYDFVKKDWLPENLMFELKSHPPLSELASFQQGWFYIQDPSTLLAVQSLGAQPGEAVLDLCAAPGGKLTYVAQQVRNEARIMAHDVSAERLKLVGENCARLGVTCAHAILPAALAAQPSATFDRILVDAPCSNTGVMRRRVDLRWRIQPEEIARLGSVQVDLLAQAARLLNPRGTLVYSTCSLEPQENEEIVTEFLQTHPGFRLESRRELLPFVEKVDGAFVAKFVR